MRWEGKVVVVTGAGGFIGSHLVERLAQEGARVRALVRYNSRGTWGYLDELPPDTRERVDIIQGDVTDPFAMDALVKGADTVFNLAALIGIPYSYVAPASYVDVNVGGTMNLLEAGRRHGLTRFVQTSTSEVYGTALRIPIDESHPLQGQSPYSATKIGADKLAESYHRAFGLPVTTVRPFNTYGPRQSARAVIPTIISQALRGGLIKLGSIAPVRDMNYVSDTVDGFVRCAAAEGTVGRVVNLASGRGVTIGHLAEIVLRILDVKVEVVADDARVRPDASEVQRLIGSAELATELTGWRSRVTLEEGLAQTIEYVKAHQGDFKPWAYAL